MESICLTATQVRTVIDKGELALFVVMEEQPEMISQGAMLRSCGVDAVLMNPHTMQPVLAIDCHFSPGERRWVAEEVCTPGPWNISDSCRLWYLADGECPFAEAVQYKSAEYAPHWASRLTVEVIVVKAMQIQEIAPEECEAQGVTGSTHSSPVRGQPYDEYRNGDGLVYGEPREAFGALWDEVHPKPEEKFDVNPWCWRISLILKENKHVG